MRRILALSLVALLVLASFAYGGNDSLTLTGSGGSKKPAAGGTGPTFTVVDQAAGGTYPDCENVSNFCRTSVNNASGTCPSCTIAPIIKIGTASASRRVLLLWTQSASYTGACTSVTDTTSATWTIIAANVGSGGSVGVFSSNVGAAWADIATGTTTTVTFTGCTEGGGGYFYVGVWTLDKTTVSGSPVSNIVNSTGTATQTNTVTLSAGSAIAAMISPEFFSTGVTDVTNTSSTETMTERGEDISNTQSKAQMADKASGAAGGSTNVVWNWTGNLQALSIVVGWR